MTGDALSALDLAVLRMRSERDKVAAPVDDQAGADPRVVSLIERGYLVWLDRAALPHVGIMLAGVIEPLVADIYALTPKALDALQRTPVKLCHCGRPLHYVDPRVAVAVETLIETHGEFVDVSAAGRRFRVPRHYVALHGLKADELPALGFEEVT